MTFKIEPHAIEQNNGPFIFPGAIGNGGFRAYGERDPLLRSYDTGSGVELYTTAGTGTFHAVNATSGLDAPMEWRGSTLTINSLGNEFLMIVPPAPIAFEGEAYFNRAQNDWDFHFNSAAGPDALFIEGSTGNVLVSHTLRLKDDQRIYLGDDDDGWIFLRSADDNLIIGSDNQEIEFYPGIGTCHVIYDTDDAIEFRLRSEVLATGTTVGGFYMDGHNDAAGIEQYGGIESHVISAVEGSEESDVRLEAMVAGGISPVLIAGANGFIWNDQGLDLDARFESAAGTHSIFLRGSDGFVGINNAAPGRQLDVNGTVRIDGDLEFEGPQTISTTSGNLIVDPASSLFIQDSTIYIQNETSYVRLYLRPGMDGGADEINILFAQDTTLKWDLGMKATNEFRLIDYSAGANTVLLVEGNSHMTFTPAGNLVLNPDGTVEVTPNANFAAGIDVIGATTLDGAVTINDAGADVDLRIETDDNPSMVFIEGERNQMGIGSAVLDEHDTLFISNDDQTAGTGTYDSSWLNEYTSMTIGATLDDAGALYLLALRGDTTQVYNNITTNSRWNPLVGEIAWSHRDTSKHAIHYEQRVSNTFGAHNFYWSRTGSFSLHPLLEMSNTETIFNGANNDIDFRVETVSGTYSLFVQGDNGYVGMGVSVPGEHLDLAYPTRQILRSQVAGDSTYNRLGRVLAGARFDQYMNVDYIPGVGFVSDDDTLGTAMYVQYSNGGQGTHVWYAHEAQTGTVAIQSLLEINPTGTVFNEVGNDIDFRVETVNLDDTLFVLGSADQVYLGGQSGLDDTFQLGFQQQAASGPLAQFNSGFALGDIEGWGASPVFTMQNLDYVVGGWAAMLGIMGMNLYHDDAADNWRMVDTSQDGAYFEFISRTNATQIVIEYGWAEATAGNAALKSLFSMMAGTGQDGWIVFNESGDDIDFRVESASGTHSLFVQGSDGFVGIGTPTPLAELEVHASLPELRLSTDSKTQWWNPGKIAWYGLDDGDNLTEYASMFVYMSAVADGSELGRIFWQLTEGGTMYDAMSLRGGGPNASYLTMRSNMATDGQEVGGFALNGKNDAVAPETITYGGGAVTIVDNADGAEEGRWQFNAMMAGLYQPHTQLDAAGLRTVRPLKILEAAAALVDEAGYGQLWVKNTDPCELWFTDDAGNDTQIV